MKILSAKAKMSPAPSFDSTEPGPAERAAVTPLDAPPLDAPPLDAPPLTGRRVLVVEDMPPTQRLYVAVLHRAGADVTLDCNGDSALATAAAAACRGEPFEAVLIDLLLAGADGLVTTHNLRAQGFSGAILAATAHWSPELAAAWRSAGCDECLAKPLDVGSLPDLIARLLAGRTAAIA